MWRSDVYFTEYDALHRPIEQWLAINKRPARSSSSYTEYGEAPWRTPTTSATCAARPSRHYDPSGLSEIERLDFKGKPLEVKRTAHEPVDDESGHWTGISPIEPVSLETETFSRSPSTTRSAA